MNISKMTCKVGPRFYYIITEAAIKCFSLRVFTYNGNGLNIFTDIISVFLDSVYSKATLRIRNEFAFSAFI